MKPWIKVLIGTLIGFGGGFAAGFFAHKRINDVEFEEITEEEMQQIEKDIQQQKEKVSAVVNTIEPDKPLSTDPDELRKQLQGKVSYIQADKEAKAAYEKVWNTVKGYSSQENADELPVDSSEEGLDPEFLEMLENEEVEPGQVEPPHPISLAEFYNERSEYDKITIDWYEPNTFLDEKEEVIADLKTYIGSIDIHELFKESDEEDPDIRFVRNEQYGTDYEIVRHHRSWSETTGIGGSE